MFVLSNAVLFECEQMKHRNVSDLPFLFFLPLSNEDFLRLLDQPCAQASYYSYEFLTLSVRRSSCLLCLFVHVRVGLLTPRNSPPYVPLYASSLCTPG